LKKEEEVRFRSAKKRQEGRSWAEEEASLWKVETTTTTTRKRVDDLDDDRNHDGRPVLLLLLCEDWEVDRTSSKKKPMAVVVVVGKGRTTSKGNEGKRKERSERVRMKLRSGKKLTRPSYLALSSSSTRRPPPDESC